MLKRTLLATSLLFPLAGGALAGDFFGINATGGGTTVSANSGSLLNLVNHLINEESQFAPLNGTNLSGTLTYGGIPNALVFSENSSQTSATITIPATGFTRTFTGASSSDLQHQIEDFIKQDGAGAYADFIKSINQTSTAAAVDGNPLAYTAFVASTAFERFGINSTLSQEPVNRGNGAQFRVEGLGGESQSSGLNGSFAELMIDADVRFSSNVALTFGTGLQYRVVAGSTTYFADEEIGLPITIFNQSRGTYGFGWTLTPWGFGGVGASTDQVAGAVLVGGGGTSSLSFAWMDLTFTLADQLSYAAGVPVNVDGYDYDTDVNQWILKNGGKITYQPGRGPFFIDAGISYSNLLHHGAVPDYWTPEAGLGIKFSRYSGIEASYSGDFGSHYSDNGGKITLFLSF